MNTLTFLSIVIPVYNEKAILSELINRCIASAERTHLPFELILVNDGSTDDTALAFKALAPDKRVRMINIITNSGQWRATQKGLEEARGDWIIVLDGDLQDPPEAIPDFIRALSDACHDTPTVFCGTKNDRNESAWFKYGHAFYQCLLKLIKPSAPLNIGSYCLMPRHIANSVKNFPVRTANLSAIIIALDVCIKKVPYRKTMRYDKRSHIGVFGLIKEGLMSLIIISPIGKRLWRKYLVYDDKCECISNP